MFTGATLKIQAAKYNFNATNPPATIATAPVNPIKAKNTNKIIKETEH